MTVSVEGATLAAAFLEGTIRSATPLLFAASGELIIERAGLMNIGLEGVILGGAFGAFLGATHGGTAFGYSTAVLSGVLVMLLFAACTLGMGADQIITGTALTLLALGTTDGKVFPPDFRQIVRQRLYLVDDEHRKGGRLLAIVATMQASNRRGACSPVDGGGFRAGRLQLKFICGTGKMNGC